MPPEAIAQVGSTDALLGLIMPDPSPSLTILQKVTDNGGKSFTLTHEPMAAPKMPPAPDLVRAGKRAHKIDTLNDLLKYVSHTGSKEKSIAFYSSAGVSVVIDETSEREREVITCTLQRTPEFLSWQSQLNKKLTHEQFVNFLRVHTKAIDAVKGAAEDAAATLVGQFLSVSGTLVHGADEYLDAQSRSIAFTVKRRVRGQTEAKENEGDVPTEFKVAMKLLPDDPEPTEFTILLRMTGDIGAQIQFTMMIEDLDTTINDHVDERLDEFSKEATFLCVRGQYQEADWAEPELPASIKSLMELHAEQLRAMNGVGTDE